MNTITMSELQTELENNKDGINLISVLTKEHFEDCKIPGSINIPLSELESRINEIDQTKKTIVYCASSDCNAGIKAYKILEDAQVAHIYDYRGGIREWKEKNGKLEGACTTPYLTDHKY